MNRNSQLPKFISDFRVLFYQVFLLRRIFVHIIQFFYYILGLIGMNIKNAIVLVDQIGIEEEKGTPRLEAIIEATKSRIVPVAMASGTTILGMLPLLFDAMFGGMAACIMGGLLVASLLTIFVLPVTYSLLFRVKVTDTPEVRMNEE